MNPIPCLHCGTLFMRTNILDEHLKLCNTCDYREKQKPKPKEKDMSKIKICIDCDPEDYMKIEEICNSRNLNLSDYFLDLHKLNTQEILVINNYPRDSKLENSEKVQENAKFCQKEEKKSREPQKGKNEKLQKV